MEPNSNLIDFVSDLTPDTRESFLNLSEDKQEQIMALSPDELKETVSSFAPKNNPPLKTQEPKPLFNEQEQEEGIFDTDIVLDNIQPTMNPITAELAELAANNLDESGELANEVITKGSIDSEKAARDSLSKAKQEQDSGRWYEKLERITQEAQAEDIAYVMSRRAIEEHKTNIALEEQAVEAVHPTAREMDKVVDEDVLATFKEKAIAELAIQNWLEKQEVKEGEESVLTETPDFFKLLLGGETLELLLDGGAESAIGDIRSVLYQAKQLPVEQQEGFLETHLRKTLNKKQWFVNNPSREMEYVAAAMDDEALKDFKYWQAVGIVALPFDLWALKALKGTGSLAKTLNNKEVLLKDLQVESAGKVSKEANLSSEIEHLSHPMDETSGGVYEVINKSLAKNELTLNEGLVNFKAPELQEEIIQRRLLDFETSYGANRVMGSKLNKKDPNKLEVMIGTAKGDAFKSKKVAENFIQKHGIEGKVVKDANGGYKIKASTAMGEPEVAGKTGLSWWGKWFGNIDNIIMEDVVSGARGVEGAQAGVYQAAKEVHNRSLKVLSSKRGRATMRIIAHGVDNNKWYTDKQFHTFFRRVNGRNPKADELEAYKAFKQLSDFDYNLKVQHLMQDAKARGESVYKVLLGDGDLTFNGAKSEFSRLKEHGVNNDSIHIMGSNHSDSATGLKGQLDEAALDELAVTHDLIKANPRYMNQFFDEGVTQEVTKWIAVPKGMAKRSDVTATNLLPYKAGGRRRNVNPAYLKVATIKKSADGTSVRLPDIATHGAISIKHAGKVADDLQELHTLMKEIGNDVSALKQLDELVAAKGLESIGISTAEDAHRWFSSRNLFSYDDVKFGGVRDRQLVDIGDKNTKSLIDENDDPIMAGIRNQTNGRRGDRLSLLDGEDGLILDPLSALADSLDMSARLASTEAYKSTMLDLMHTKFGKYLDIRVGTDPIKILTNRTYTGGAENNLRLQRLIEAHQEFLKDILTRRTGWQEEFVVKAEAGIDAIFDSARWATSKLGDGWMATKVGNKLDKARQGTLDAIAVDPVSRVKNMVFNAKLGMFNPASLIIQALNMTNIIALSPKYGSKAAMHALPIRLALTSGVDGAMRNVIAKGWKAAGYKSEQDFFDLLREFRGAGLGHLDRGIAEVAGASGSQFGSSVVGSIAEHGRIFFNEGEIISRVTAFAAARLKWQAKDGVNKAGRAASSPEGVAWIRHEAHRLSLGLSRADVQLGFRGAKGLGTQFFSYPFRLLGAMMPGKASAFTNWEKTRLTLMQGLLYGSAGIPIVDIITNHYVANSDTLSAAEGKALTNGLFDSIVYNLSDGQASTNLAGRAGAGQFVTDLYNQLYKAENKTFVSVVGGAGGQMTGNLIAVSARVLEGLSILREPSLDKITYGAMEILKEEISGLKMADKIIAAQRYGVLLTKNGTRLADITNVETWLMGAGFTPQAYEYSSHTFLSDAEKRSEVKRLSTTYIKAYKDLQIAYEAGDMEKVERLQGYINITAAQALDLGIDKEVIAKFHSSEINQSMLQQRTQDAMLNGDKFFNKQIQREHLKKAEKE